ncbi:hypothetical protein [Pseudomonas sp. NPDC087639]|uniref:hypothetical protein n=1 Tax=Pseudomonas sp. NPDC087639 TaxID=3364445 RepID=UPI00382CE0B1
MSAARKLQTPVRKRSALENTFSASIDGTEPLNFKAVFEQVTYPQEGEPPRWTIEARYRDPNTNHIQTVRVIFLKNPANNKPVLANEELRVLYSNTAEDPPAEYFTNDATTAIEFDEATAAVKGTISATVDDGLESQKSHELTIEFDLVAEEWSKRM